MKAHEFLTEIGSFNYKFKEEPYYLEDNKNWQRILFNIANKVASYFSRPVAGKKYTFSTDSGAKYEVYLDLYMKSGLNIRFFYVNRSGIRLHKLTGTAAGEELRIISTVRQIAKKYIDEVHPSVIAFSAVELKETSRFSLYDRIARDFSRYFPEYKFRSSKDTQHGKTWFFGRTENYDNTANTRS